MKLIKQISLSYIYQIIGSFIVFVLNLYFAKVLSVKEFGEFNLMFSFVSIMSSILIFGGSYYIQILDLNKKNDFLSLKKYFTTYFILSLILSGLTLFSDFDFRMKIALILGFIGTSLLEIQRAYTVNVNKAAFGYFVKYIVYYLIVVLLLFIGELYHYSIVYNLIIYSYFLTPFFISIPFILKNIRFSKTDYGFFSSIMPFAFIQFLYLANNHLIKLTQGLFSSVEVLGLFSMSMLFVRVITLLPMNMSLIFMPKISRYFNEKKEDLLKYSYHTILALNISYTIPTTIFLFVSSSRILKLIDPKYLQADGYLKISLLYVLLLSFMGPNGTFLLMTKKQNLEVVNGILLIVTGIISLLLFSKFSFYGVAFAFVLSELLVIILKRIVVKNIFSFNLFSMRQYILLITFSLISYLLFYFSLTIVSDITWLISSVILIISLIVVLIKLIWLDEKGFDYRILS